MTDPSLVVLYNLTLVSRLILLLLPYMVDNQSQYAYLKWMAWRGRWSSYLYTCICASHCHVWDFATPWTVACRLLYPWNSPDKNTGWAAILFSRKTSWPRDLTQVSCIADRFFTIWATWEISYLYLLHSKRDFKIKDTCKISFLGDLLTTYIPASVSLFCNLHNLKLNRLENSYTYICVCIYI